MNVASAISGLKLGATLNLPKYDGFLFLFLTIILYRFPENGGTAIVQHCRKVHISISFYIYISIKCL